MASDVGWTGFGRMTAAASLACLPASALADIVTGAGFLLADSDLAGFAARAGLRLPPAPTLLAIGFVAGLLMALPATVLLGVPLAWRLRAGTGQFGVTLGLVMVGALLGLMAGMLFDLLWQSRVWWWPGLTFGLCHAAMLATLMRRGPLPGGKWRFANPSARRAPILRWPAVPSRKPHL